jgi:hypothetical protein
MATAWLNRISISFAPNCDSLDRGEHVLMVEEASSGSSSPQKKAGDMTALATSAMPKDNP